jgi:dolichol-phosphate mannosyltransferase
MLSIVVPTYCEADNLAPLIEKIDDVLMSASIKYEIIIADDNSPDETAEVIAALSSRYPVSLLQAENRPRDLSLSVLEGVVAASSDDVLVMDADLSHPPEVIPVLYKTLLDDKESFVVGSRYVKEGSFDRQWSLWRFLNSQVATILTRPLVACRDPMSGFFAFNRTVIGDLSKLNPIGYKIGLELMVRGSFSKVHEVPIRFQDREFGESKMNLRQQLHFLRHLRRLYTARFGTIGEFVSFGFVGASGFVVDLFFYFFFQFVGAPHEIARAMSFWPAVSWNWRLNRISTFGERKRRPKTKQWIEFVLASLLGFSLNWGVYVTLTGQVPFFDQYRVLALICGIGVASVLNFVISTLYVYNEKRI